MPLATGGGGGGGPLVDAGVDAAVVVAVVTSKTRRSMALPESGLLDFIQLVSEASDASRDAAVPLRVPAYTKLSACTAGAKLRGAACPFSRSARGRQPVVVDVAPLSQPPPFVVNA